MSERLLQLYAEISEAEALGQDTTELQREAHLEEQKCADMIQLQTDEFRDLCKKADQVIEDVRKFLGIPREEPTDE